MRTVGRNTQTPGDVLIVTGPAAACKTTVARRVAEESAEPSVHLHGDNFFKALKTGRRRGWMDGAEAQHEVVFEAIGAAAGVYAAGGYFVVADTLVRRQFLDTLVVEDPEDLSSQPIAGVARTRSLSPYPRGATWKSDSCRRAGGPGECPAPGGRG